MRHSGNRSISEFKSGILLLCLGSIALFLAGCGMFNASGQVGPDLRPHFGTSLSVPLDK
jgi:hypothetical protein